MAELAARQHGVVARRQALALGLTRGAIARRVEKGQFHLVHSAVYAVGHAKLTVRGRWMAAVLACGEGAVLSHWCAAGLLELMSVAAAPVHVTVPRSYRGRAGIKVHRVRRLHPEDHAEVDGIPVTSVERTLLDLADVTTPRRLANAFEQAERLRLLDVRALSRLLDRSNGRRVRALRRLLAEHCGPVPDTRLELERRFVEFLRDARIPLPALNVLVEGYEVDGLWHDDRLIVELDGYETHGTRAAFERDRARDAALQVAGYRVLRVTWRALHRDAAGLAKTIRSLRALGAGGR